MSLLNPAWLLLIAVLALVDYRWPVLGLRRPARALTALLLIVALADPRISRFGDGRDVALLVDRSASAESGMAKHRAEWESLVDSGRRAGDRLRIYDFAAAAVRRDRGDPGFPVDREQTLLADAVRHAVQDRDPDRPLRIAVLTDGFSSQPLENLDRLLGEAGVPLDYRLLPPPDAADARISRLQLPMQTQPGSSELIEFTLQGRDAAPVEWQVLRGDVPVASGTAMPENGVARIRVADTFRTPGLVAYTVRIRSADDPQLANNVARGWVQVSGGKRAVLLTPYADDPLAALLSGAGWTVERPDPSRLGPADLVGARLVIFNNLAAWKLDSRVLESLGSLVSSEGGGLLMLGGKSSFGGGGFFETAVGDLLPVSLEQRTEHRRLSAAMSIVLDRSGSMAVGTPDGRTKMDLANEGAAAAASLLGDRDLIGVVAVDSEPHEMLPLMPVGPNRGLIDDVVRRINSTGGGIFVHNGLSAGWKQLQQSDVRQRHLVLFSDAGDSEEPGDYPTLLRQMVAAGASVSVIALGTEQDSDAELLKDIARLGGGRIYFASDAATLPQIFAQETVAVARSAFLDAPVGVKGTPGWIEISGRPGAWLPQVDGYNLTYLRPGATASAVSGDDYGAPLVAAWQRGAGRAGAITFPVAGDFSEQVRRWTGYQDFVLTICRWLGGDDTPAGLGLRTKVVGNRLQLELLHAGEETEPIVAKGPEAWFGIGSAGEPRRLQWERVEPGRYTTSLGMPLGQWVRGVVRAGRHSLPFGPVAVAGSPEWDYSQTALAELRSLSQVTGGFELQDLRRVWAAPIPGEGGRSLARVLLLAAVLVFLIDVGLTQTGWPLDRLRRRRPALPAVPPSGGQP